MPRVPLTPVRERGFPHIQPILAVYLALARRLNPDKMKRMSTEPSTPSILERILAYASLSIIALALLSFFATLIVGLNNRFALAEGLWPVVYGISMIGLPVGFVLLIALLILTQRRRRLETRRISGR